jgi:hypothetical protein
MEKLGPRLSPRQEIILTWLIIVIVSTALVGIFAVWIATVIIGLKTSGNEIFAPHAAAIIGVPASAAVAFMVVIVFRQTYGPVEFEAMTIKFKGASGPIILWALCSLVLVTAIKILW